MKRLHLLIVTLLLSLGIGVAYAVSDYWADKPYTKWSEKEAKHMLSDSPWAKTVTLRHTVLKQTRRDFGSLANSNEGEGVSEPEIDYSVYIRTATPVREALVRLAQFEQKYDHMDDDSRKAFDGKWEQFLATAAGDKVIFQVKYSANTADVDRNLANYWQTQTVETIRDNGAAMTGPDGARVAPIAFWTARGAGREFQVAFPRPKGESTGGSVAVEFGHPNVGEPSTRIFAKFPLKEMQYKGATTY
jgi:hypothetical protein